LPILAFKNNGPVSAKNLLAVLRLRIAIISPAIAGKNVIDKTRDIIPQNRIMSARLAYS
jgi:hypothetical protein